MHYGQNKCIDLDECSSPDLNNCPPTESSCHNIPGSYKCSCKNGYELIGGECLDIDECKLGKEFCDRNAICKNLPGSYECVCQKGFYGSGSHCEGLS